MDPAPGQKPPETPPPRWWRKAVRLALRTAGVGLLLLVVAVLFWLRGALYHRWVRFPREAAAWAALRAQRLPVTDNAGWPEFRGILHSHSLLSHDCEVPFPEILRALKAARIDFICLSDHCVQGRADFSAQWRGLHEGKLFIPGFEMKEGNMPFGVASSVTLSERTDGATLAREVIANGGVLFYAHSEDPRVWDRPELTGMEIYNIHSDLRTQPHGARSLLPDVLLNEDRYPDQVMRLLFHRPTAFLQRWDELNRTRHITGIAGNDCHQNNGVRAFITGTNTLYVEDTSPRRLVQLPLNWFTRPLARLCFGPLEPGRRVFHIQHDPYERVARYVNTHVLARELSEGAVLDALRAGRVFVGFDMIADSSGFRWVAQGLAERAVMGESLVLAPEVRLQARSPLPCRFTILQDGRVACRQEGRALDWTPPGPGKYRVEAELNVAGEWVPWVYANPLELR